MGLFLIIVIKYPTSKMVRSEFYEILNVFTMFLDIKQRKEI